MNTTAVYGNYRPLTIPGPANLTEALQAVKKFSFTVLDDLTYLCQFPKGVEKTAKMVLSFFSCFEWVADRFSLVLAEAKVVCMVAAQTTLKSVAETFGAFHIFGSGQKLCTDYHKSSVAGKISLVFLAVSDSFETLLYLQKQQLVSKITAASRFVKPVIEFLAFIAHKTGTYRLFSAVFDLAGKVTVNHIKCYTQVIGVSFGLVEIFKIIADIKKESKHGSSYLKVASDLGKIGLIVFSGSLGFWTGYTGTFAFRFLWALPATIAPVARLVYDYHQSKAAKA